MRKLTLTFLATYLLVTGCKPAQDESLPKITNPSPTSATTDDAAPAAEAKPAEATAPAAETPAATPAAEAAPAAESPAPAAESPAPATSDARGAGKVRFVADKKLTVPAMMCPFGCYPAVEKALTSVPGVEGVQLAEQPEGTPEGEISLKVVELKLGDKFDLNSAIAALKQAEFDASEAQ